MRKLFPVFVVALLATVAYRKFHDQPSAAEPQQLYDTEAESIVGPKYECDGRKRCSQMHSCEEATWFIQHCPGMEMDGDGDGVPCERQWCERE